MSYKKIKIFILVLPTIMLGACVTANLPKIPKHDNSFVSVNDNRTEKDKAEQRDNVLSAAIFLGDTDLDTNLKDYFIYKLTLNKPKAINSVNVQIDKLRVVDYFPKRMSVGIREWVFMPNTDIKVVSKNDLPTNTDMVITYFKGKVNGKDLIAKGVYPYKMKPSSVMVRSDPNFIRAVNKSIDITVNSVYKQVQ